MFLPGAWAMVVLNRSASTLMTNISKAVVPGSEVQTDGWRGYLSLNDEGFQHESVNHKEAFVKNKNGHKISTNIIEGTYSSMKRSARRLNLFQRTALVSSKTRLMSFYFDLITEREISFCVSYVCYVCNILCWALWTLHHRRHWNCELVILGPYNARDPIMHLTRGFFNFLLCKFSLFRSRCGCMHGAFENDAASFGGQTRPRRHCQIADSENVTHVSEFSLRGSNW